jgi:OPA family glycerol-3-phosphate transporter-like MFS transporter
MLMLDLLKRREPMSRAEAILPSASEHPATHGLRSRKIATVALLFTGYAAYYFCRVNLPICLPLLVEELGRHGIARSDAILRIGEIASLGTLAYALGNIFLTGLGDIWGGKRSFVIGLGGAVVFSLLFISNGILPIFTIAWIGNRLTQSIGWAGLIKVCSRWFDYSSYGTVIGILSLSFLVGDAIARQTMGLLIQIGFGWRRIFIFSACVAGSLLLLNLLFLRESRAELGYSEPETNPLNVFAGIGEKPKSLWEILKPLLRSRAFLVICFLSLSCTLIRESFSLWDAAYLREFFGYTASRAAGMSSVFPAVGAISVLFTGWMSDRLGATGRSMVMFFSLAASVLPLIAMTALRGGSSNSLLPVVLIGAVALFLLGPYSYLAGAFALDIGGSQAGAASAGFIDGVGYLGGALAGVGISRLLVAFGWQGVFAGLMAVSVLSALAAGYLFVYQRGLKQKIA